MDMLHQEPSYAEYAYTHGLIPLGAKLKFEKDWENCLEKVSTMMLVVGVVVVWWCGSSSSSIYCVCYSTSCNHDESTGSSIGMLYILV